MTSVPHLRCKNPSQMCAIIQVSALTHRERKESSLTWRRRMYMTELTPSGYNPQRLQALREREDARFHARIPRSLELSARARQRMPNGVPMAWMAGLYRHPPLFVVEGSGASFRDVDGHTYLDMNQADLSMNCGYGSPPIVLAGGERLRQGSQFLLP